MTSKLSQGRISNSNDQNADQRSKSKSLKQNHLLRSYRLNSQQNCHSQLQSSSTNEDYKLFQSQKRLVRMNHQMWTRDENSRQQNTTLRVSSILYDDHEVYDYYHTCNGQPQASYAATDAQSRNSIGEINRQPSFYFMKTLNQPTSRSSLGAYPTCKLKCNVSYDSIGQNGKSRKLSRPEKERLKIQSNCYSNYNQRDTSTYLKVLRANSLRVGLFNRRTMSETIVSFIIALYAIHILSGDLLYNYGHATKLDGAHKSTNPLYLAQNIPENIIIPNDDANQPPPSNNWQLINNDSPDIMDEPNSADAPLGDKNSLTEEQHKLDKMLTEDLIMISESENLDSDRQLSWPSDFTKDNLNQQYNRRSQDQQLHQPRHRRHQGRSLEKKFTVKSDIHKSLTPDGMVDSYLDDDVLAKRDRREPNLAAFATNPFDSMSDRPLVATKKGYVRGITQKTVTGKFVDAFLGIPFAQPPIGQYRFKHPQPINPWSGELDASRLSNSCYQVNDTFFGTNFGGTSVWNANTPLSEDCLYLNIWTPFGVANTTITQPTLASSSNYRSSRSLSKRPVLVWIYGGGFYSGTSSLALYEGGVLASEEDILVVSMNYRISALGFLYFGRPDAPGNAGLFDQLMALQWINDNIEQFGGDPSRVTIFGESSGAVSVSFHLLSPLSRNLFSQAILQSGAATCPWGYMDTREIKANGLQLAKLVDCPSNSSDLDLVIECLQRADPMSLVSMTQNVGQINALLNFAFVPVVDGSFLLENPKESLARSNFKQTKIMLGSNHDEGNSYLIYLAEFSHCPSNGNSAPQKVVQKPPPLPSLSMDDSSNENSGESAVVSELRDMNGMQLESLNLLGSERQRNTGPTQRGSQTVGPNIDVNLANNRENKSCKPNEYMAFTREDFTRVLTEDINPFASNPIGKDAIIFEYSNWNNLFDPISNYDALDKIVGDYYFTCNVNEFAYRYANSENPVYMYYFKQRSSVSAWPKWMGVLHGDEIGFVFGEPLNPALNYTEKEIDLSRRMMKYWANFAKFGNPTKTSENTSSTEKWPEYGDKKQYFELHADYIRVGKGPRAKQCAFWSHYLPKLIESFDRSQCSAQTQSSYSHFHPPLQQHQQSRTGFLSTIPSQAMLGIFVIILVAIVGLLIYANRTGKLDLNLGSSEDSN